MAWVKLDDSMPMHPKVIEAGPEAFALDVAAICYSNRYGTDGHISKQTLKHLLPGLDDPEHFASILLRVGRWESDGGGYLIHDIHDYQRDAKTANALSVKRAAAGRKGGNSSGKAREAKLKQVASSKPKQTPSKRANPDPTRPDPTDTTSLPTREASRRKPDPIWDAVLQACGLDQQELTSSARGAANRAVQQLKQVAATPEEVNARAHKHRTEWPGATLTPASLAKNWAQLAASRQQTSSHCSICGQPKTHHDDEICRIVQGH